MCGKSDKHCHIFFLTDDKNPFGGIA